MGFPLFFFVLFFLWHLSDHDVRVFRSKGGNDGGLCKKNIHPSGETLWLFCFSVDFIVQTKKVFFINYKNVVWKSTDALNLIRWITESAAIKEGQTKVHEFPF